MANKLIRIYRRWHLHFITFSCYRRVPFFRSVLVALRVVPASGDVLLRVGNGGDEARRRVHHGGDMAERVGDRRQLTQRVVGERRDARRNGKG